MAFSHKTVVQLRMSKKLFAAKTHLDGTTHEQTIICRQLFTGHLVGSRPVKRKEKMHRMMILILFFVCVSGLYPYYKMLHSSGTV